MRKYTMVLIFAAAMRTGSGHLQAQAGAAGSLVQAGPPMYPLAAKAAGIEGKVTLKGMIDTDGHIEDLQVIKGPPQLQQAALDAVAHWAYHPYTDHGHPVPMPTKVNVIFSLGNKKEKAKAIAEAQAALAKNAASTSGTNAASATRGQDQ